MIREKFVARFGETEARLLEDAAAEHANSANDQRRGSDPFKWVLCICIGYECFERDAFRRHHRISAPYDQLKNWIKAEADLASHDGDVDYLTALIGGYKEYV